MAVLVSRWLAQKKREVEMKTPMQERMKERMGEKEFAAVRPNPPFRPSKLDVDDDVVV